MKVHTLLSKLIATINLKLFSFFLFYVSFSFISIFFMFYLINNNFFLFLNNCKREIKKESMSNVTFLVKFNIFFQFK